MMKISRRWTKQIVVRKIQRFREKKGFPSLCRVSRENPRLLEVSYRFFVAWEFALVAAGVICPPFEPGMYFDHNMCAWAHDALNGYVQRY